MKRRNTLGLICAAGMVAAMLPGCRGEPQRVAPGRLQVLVDSLRPQVERVTGLQFKGPIQSAMQTKDQVRSYLLRRFDEEIPPAKLTGIEDAYRLFGLIPDTLDLRGLLLDLYTEQVAGYYDPESNTLFGVEGADPAQLKLVLAHELVHALQDQYTNLDSLLSLKGDDDRQSAAQAILEGQANLASLQLIAPERANDPAFWDTFLDALRQQQSTMPVFARSPLVVREDLLFPYVAGAEFMRWWATSPLKDTVPYGPRMPVSTEQILHPERYLNGDEPDGLRFADTDSAEYDNVLGELELHVLDAVLKGSEDVVTRTVPGWGGDRFRVYATPNGPALVWYTVWDSPVYAQRFELGLGARMAMRSRQGYRTAMDTLTVDSLPAVRITVAPAGWTRWGREPGVELRR